MFNLETLAREHGFDLCGCLRVGPSTTTPALREWLRKDMHGTMDWMARPDALEKRADPRQVLPHAQSIIVCAFQYTPPEIPAELLNDPSRGIIARYALYDDYHSVIERKLKAFAQEIQRAVGPCAYKAYVDTGPVLEREWASTAGLGFVGRNANVINYQLGSYIFLCELIVDIELPEMRTRQIGSCGTCHRCGDACPTGAIVADRTIDARKCISYLTIEHRGAIPEWIRPLMKNRIYGCDICQEVCPWNGKPKAQTKADFRVREDLVAPKLETLLFFDDESFRARFKKSPIKRAKREGFMRNVAIALGNWGTADAHALLNEMLVRGVSPLVREHVQWALSRVH
jgi:epoxyqueuosine reductase